MQKQDLKSNLRDFSFSFSGSKATSLNSAFLILSFLTFGTWFTDFNGPASMFDEWALVAGLSLAFGITYFSIFSYFINRYAEKYSVIRTCLVSILFFTTEMFRAVFVAQAEINLKITQAIDWDYRVVAGGFTGVLFFGIFSIVKNDSQIYHDKLFELSKVQKDLENTTKVTRSDLVNIRNNAVNIIRQELNRTFSELLKKSQSSKDTGRTVVDELVRVADDVIRPLSHDVFSVNNASEKQKLDRRPPKFATRQLFQEASINPFFPVPITFFASIQIVGLAMFGVENVVDGFLALFTYSSWIFFISFLAKKFLKPKLQDIDIFLRFIYVSLVYITIALCPFLFDSVSDTLRIPQNWAFAIYLSSIALIMIWPITFYVAIRNLRNVAVDQIRLNNERLSWSSARLGAQLWAEKQKFAHLLHKDIQGALISSALKLKNDLDSGVNPTDSISKIRAFLEDSANLNLDEQSRTTSEHIEFLKDIWSGVLNLEIKISSKSNERLLNDPVAQNSVNDLLTEFATNSIKHGKAKFGKVQIELASEQVLLVNLQNDGLPLPKIIQHGMGSNMALEQCLTIDQKNLEPAGVEFTFTLPID